MNLMDDSGVVGTRWLLQGRYTGWPPFSRLAGREALVETLPSRFESGLSSSDILPSRNDGLTDRKRSAALRKPPANMKSTYRKDYI